MTHSYTGPAQRDGVSAERAAAELADMALAITGTPQEAMPPPAISQALTERLFQGADAERDRHFGATLREMVDGKHGPGAGARLRDAIIKPTRPNSPEREKQDHAWQLLSARLNKLAGSAE